MLSTQIPSRMDLTHGGSRLRIKGVSRRAKDVGFSALPKGPFKTVLYLAGLTYAEQAPGGLPKGDGFGAGQGPRRPAVSK